MGVGLTSLPHRPIPVPGIGPSDSPDRFARALACWPSAGRDLLLLGLYLTFRGYHSLDGDQAYRLPLLLHQLDPSLYAADPFVRAFDAFNPHRGWLTLLAGLTATLGLSASLFVLFVAIFLLTCRGIDRLARAAWPDRAGSVGSIALILVLLAKAGNIGTNHLFEAMVLDRLAALALGWNAIAEVIGRPERGGARPAILLGMAALIHPSLGLQLAVLVAGVFGLCAILGERAGVRRPEALMAAALALAGILPGMALNLQSGQLLTAGLPAGDLWNLAVELQGPQHMLPHLWRLPQWLAWGSYLVLAALATGSTRTLPRERLRLVLALVLILAGLAVAWAAIEGLQHIRLTLFQPFRMATVARGLALVLIAGRVETLGSNGTWLGRGRCILLAAGLAGDWMMVVAAATELSCTCAEVVVAAVKTSCSTRRRLFPHGKAPIWFGLLNWLPGVVLAGTFAGGLVFLGRHDTESGHRVFAVVLAAWITIESLGWRWYLRAPAASWKNLATWRAGVAVLALSWTVPALALLAGSVPRDSHLARSGFVGGLVARCRFTPVPIDDIERLGLWCREHTPQAARFIGPPGPKTFRLWSRRCLAFNRAGSPYHASGLADWFARFREHVGSSEPAEVFVRRYQTGRHRLESGYDRLNPIELAALARRQEADHVVALAPGAWQAEGDPPRSDAGPLRLLHAEGRYAVYRVEASANSDRLCDRP